MDDIERATQLLDPIMAVADRLDALSSACKDKYDVLIADAIKKGPKTTLVYSDASNVKDYWYALADFVSFSNELIAVSNILQKPGGNLEYARKEMEQMEKSIEEYKDINEQSA